MGRGRAAPLPRPLSRLRRPLSMLTPTHHHQRHPLLHRQRRARFRPPRRLRHLLLQAHHRLLHRSRLWHLSLVSLPARTPPVGLMPSITLSVPHLTCKPSSGTGDCDGAVNGANGLPIKVPCSCPPDQATFNQVCDRLYNDLLHGLVLIACPIANAWLSISLRMRWQARR
jgi:hypothetical protein